MHLNDQASRKRGILLVLLAALLWSFAGLLMRMVTLDVWTIQLWRGISTLGMLLVALFWTHGRNIGAEIRKLDSIDAFCACLGTVAMFSFVSAVAYTTVADVLVVYATLPFFAAIFAWLVSREAIGSRIMIGSFIALFGVLVMVSGSTGEGHLLGDLLSLSMTVSFALQIVVLRRYRDKSIILISTLSVSIGSVFSLIFAPLTLPQPHDLLVLSALGALTIGLGMLLFTVGSRLIPSAEASLIGLIEVVLAPLWVWLAFSENPGLPAILGGLCVLLAVCWQIVGELLENRTIS